MSPLVARLVRFVRQHALLTAGDRVVVALSGGPDSVALLRALVDGAPVLDVTVAGAAHLHHGLRGADADADEAFCRTMAAALGVAIHVEREDVGERARRTGRSIEAAGHDARVEFYGRALAALGGNVVATGHTADDVAESVVLHLGRGAGVRGLSGIRPRNDQVVRPLLAAQRSEIVQDLAVRGQDFRSDASNGDRRFTRNRVRHDVLPVLRDALSPRIVEALNRVARLATDDEEVLDELARQRAALLARAAGDGAWSVDLDGLGREPLALRRRIVERVLRAAGARDVLLAHVDATLTLADTARPDAALALPGLRATIEGGRFVLRPAAGRRDDKRPTPAGDPVGIPMSRIPIPGVLRDDRGHWELTARLAGPMDESEVRRVAAGRDTAVIDAGLAGARLFVRSRQPGDRIRPIGMSGRRKVQDVLVDAGVPREARDDVPIVVDDAGTLVWVAGHVVADHVRVSGATTGVLLLCFRRIPSQRPENAASAPEPREGDRPGVGGRSG